MPFRISTYLDTLRSKGGSITPIRKGILQVLKQASTPLTARQVHALLRQQGLTAHRATVYRDIELCAQLGLVESFTFKGKPVIYYEIVTDHHHHFMCEQCGYISQIRPEEIEAAIALFQTRMQQQGFDIHSHRLKFYGLCATCQPLSIN